jgi:hypothetical protein
VSWLAVKAGDGSHAWPQFARSLPLRQRGIKLYSWTYHYGGEGEDDPVIRALDAGSDGHIFDVEAEFSRVPQPGVAAYNLLMEVLLTFPRASLAYSPLPVIDNFPGLPYETFNGDGVLALPQFYTKALGTGVEYSLERLISIWREWIERWSEKPVAVYPVLQGYGSQTPDNLRQEARACLNHYGGFSVWAWHTLTPEMWRAIGDG